MSTLSSGLQRLQSDSFRTASPMEGEASAAAGAAGRPHTRAAKTSAAQANYTVSVSGYRTPRSGPSRDGVCFTEPRMSATDGSWQKFRNNHITNNAAIDAFT